MVSWSTKRQVFYISSALIIFLFALALPTFFVVYKAPSCTDGKQNQGEQGIDCGGPCSILCKASARDIIVHWQRAFPVKDGIYNALAYVENPNLASGIRSISYTFKLYDKDSTLIYERKGQTFIPPRKIFGIFESNINTGKHVPVTAFFEFSSAQIWQKDSSTEAPITTSNSVLSSENGMPRLTALLENRSNNTIYNIEVVAIVYDETDNAIGASRTIVDSVSKGETAPLAFTWPQAFGGEATRIELLYRVLR